MLTDHIGAFLLERIILANYTNISTANVFVASLIQDDNFIRFLYQVNLVLRCLGKISFLLYAFLLVEGFFHTHNLKKYILSLFTFSLISEIPFDLAVSGQPFFGNLQNVYFTLCIGLVVIACFNKTDHLNLAPFLQLFIKGVLLGAGCLLAYGIKCDYSIFGVAAIALLYQFRFHRNFSVLAGGMLLAVSIPFGMGSLLAILPVSLYNGKRGLHLKYFFYFFYPVHIFLLYLVVRWMGLEMIVIG